MDIIKQLNWRYATKVFDKNKKVSEENLQILLESLRLSTSGFGVQPWKFILINNPEIRNKLKEISWGQSQVVDASHYLVFAIPDKIDEIFINDYISQIAKARGVTLESLNGFKEIIKGHFGNMDKVTIQNRASQQVHIALGSLTIITAMLNIDTCAIGGIEPAKYDEILGLDKRGWKTIIGCAIGYRDDSDKYSTLPKVRNDFEKVVEIIE